MDTKHTVLKVDGLDTAKPAQAARYRLSADLGRYGHFDSKGQIAPLATGGAHMNLVAYMRSLALIPLSGYLNAAMGRKIANGAANSTLNLKATHGQLDGKLQVTLSNFRLAAGRNKKTDVALGLSLDTALSLVRSKNDTVKFSTAILGNITKPYFSMANLTREAILAGLRHALTSVYSPLGLLNKAKNAIVNIGHALSFHPIAFVAGKHYIPPQGRQYLAHIDKAMLQQPGLALTITGHAVPADAAAMSASGGRTIDSGNRGELTELAQQRAAAVRDYLAARNIATDRLALAEPAIDAARQAQPQAALSLKH